MHCHGGTHRSAVFGVLYRTMVQNWTWNKAVREFDVLGGDPDMDKAILEAVKKK